MTLLLVKIKKTLDSFDIPGESRALTSKSLGYFFYYTFIPIRML